MKVKRIFWLYLFLLLIDMAVIFVFSAQNGTASSEISKGITTSVIDNMGKNAEELTGQEFHDVELVVRKAAHIVLYALLGVFAYLTLKASEYVKNKWYIFIIAIILCILYASSDEYHQTFSNGRDGSVVDVLIDSAGSLAGICSVWLVSKKFSFGIR